LLSSAAPRRLSIVPKNLIRLAALALLAVPSLAAAQAPEPDPAPPADDEEPPARSMPAPSMPAPSAPQRFTPPPPPEPPALADRSGATFEMSLGLGFTRVVLGSGESHTFTGLSGLNLGIGGWISPNTAITVRIAGTSFSPDNNPDIRLIAGLVALSAQYMVADRAWIGAGLGIVVLTSDQDDIEPETGFSLDLRAGVNIFQSRQNAVHLALELTPGFYDGLDVTGIGLQLGWQSF
jgi:hypothetical protein